MNSMAVEAELLNYLQQSKALKDKTEGEIARKQRYIDMVACYYGFRDVKWPTYEDLGEIYEDVSRQRVHQILQKAFLNHAKAVDFPVVRRCADILKQRSYWYDSVYIDTLIANGIEVAVDNIHGLLSLMHDLGLCVDYKAYTPDFREMTRTLFNQGLQVVLLPSSHADALRAALKLASDRPGLVGIANLKELWDSEGWTEEFYDTVRSSVALSSRAWSWQDKNDFWYTFEHRQTTLRTYSEKVFSVISATTPSHLAHVYENALHARTVSISLPPLYVIEKYLSESLLFKREGGLIRYTSHIAAELTDIERAVVDFFKGKPKADYIELRDNLLNLGFSKPWIDKLTHSCLVYVDRSMGRKLHTYSLVNQFEPIPEANSSLNEYELYRERLRILYQEETDEASETTRRKEHALLQSWLFKNKVTECCALCGEEFHVSALITAHKKKRSNCTTAERLDPHIVMPACALGCDFMYERGYVYVEDGKVQVNSAKKLHTTEYKRAEILAGKVVSERWLAGKSEYFGKPE